MGSVALKRGLIVKGPCTAAVVIVCLHAPGAAQGQSDTLAKSIAEAAKQIEARMPSPEIPDEQLTKAPLTALAALVPYQRSTVASVRQFASMLIWRVGTRSGNGLARMQAVERLTEACSDEAALVAQHASSYLLSFSAADFSARSKERLHELLQEEPPLFNVVLAVGVASMAEELPRLESLASTAPAVAAAQRRGWLGSPSWAARLARARLGIRQDLESAVKVVQTESDTILRVTRLLRDLGYTRQPEAFAEIGRYLASEDTLPGTKATDPGMKVAQYAIDVLAANLEGFPIRNKYVGGYSETDVSTARSWMRSRFPA